MGFYWPSIKSKSTGEYQDQQYDQDDAKAAYASMAKAIAIAAKTAAEAAEQ